MLSGIVLQAVKKRDQQRRSINKLIWSRAVVSWLSSIYLKNKAIHNNNLSQAAKDNEGEWYNYYFFMILIVIDVC
jgi:hypothetical protein